MKNWIINAFSDSCLQILQQFSFLLEMKISCQLIHSPRNLNNQSCARITAKGLHHQSLLWVIEIQLLDNLNPPCCLHSLHCWKSGPGSGNQTYALTLVWDVGILTVRLNTCSLEIFHVQNGHLFILIVFGYKTRRLINGLA